MQSAREFDLGYTYHPARLDKVLRDSDPYWILELLTDNMPRLCLLRLMTIGAEDAKDWCARTVNLDSLVKFTRLQTLDITIQVERDKGCINLPCLPELEVLKVTLRDDRLKWLRNARLGPWSLCLNSFPNLQRLSVYGVAETNVISDSQEWNWPQLRRLTIENVQFRNNADESIGFRNLLKSTRSSMEELTIMPPYWLLHTDIHAIGLYCFATLKHLECSVRDIWTCSTPLISVVSIDIPAPRRPPTHLHSLSRSILRLTPAELFPKVCRITMHLDADYDEKCPRLLDSHTMIEDYEPWSQVVPTMASVHEINLPRQNRADSVGCRCDSIYLTVDAFFNLKSLTLKLMHTTRAAPSYIIGKSD